MMTCARSVKINFQGESRDVTLHMPPTLAGLQATVSSIFSADLPSRSTEAEVAADGDLRFICKDLLGDDFAFDKDAELSLALRLSPEPLEISAARKLESKIGPHDSDRIYKMAARNLREYHGVSSMTFVKLTRTLDLLKLGPRRLVKQGLAPKILRKATKGKRVLPGDQEADEALAEMVGADMELMAVEVDAEEDDAKEHNADLVEDEADKSLFQEKGGDGTMEIRDANKQSNRRPKMPIHAVLIAAGIKLRPREVSPLLVALGVHPHHFVKLGLIDANDLPSPPLPGSRPRGGKLCGPMRRRIGFLNQRLILLAPPPVATVHTVPLERCGPHLVEVDPIHVVPLMHEGDLACIGDATVRRCGPGGRRGCDIPRRRKNHCG